MLKFQMIGYAGKDAVVQVHGTDSVINFSVCHTDKYKDANGQKYEKATWVSCSWWVDNTNIAQYIKKGTMLWVEGIPEAKNFKDKEGKYKAYLNMRVMRVELLGGKRDDNQEQNNSSSATGGSQDGYKPVSGVEEDDSLPF